MIKFISTKALGLTLFGLTLVLGAGGLVKVSHDVNAYRPSIPQVKSVTIDSLEHPENIVSSVAPVAPNTKSLLPQTDESFQSTSSLSTHEELELHKDWDDIKKETEHMSSADDSEDNEHSEDEDKNDEKHSTVSNSSKTEKDSEDDHDSSKDERESEDNSDINHDASD